MLKLSAKKIEDKTENYIAQNKIKYKLFKTDDHFEKIVELRLGEEILVKVCPWSLIKIFDNVPSTFFWFTKIVRPSTVSLNCFSFKSEDAN